jgi:hypothetical protein
VLPPPRRRQVLDYMWAMGDAALRQPSFDPALEVEVLSTLSPELCEEVVGAAYRCGNYQY